MPTRLPAFPDLPEHSYTVTLGDAVYTLRFVWRERLAAWYMDLGDSTGTPIVQGVRLTTSWAPFESHGITGLAGVIYVRGNAEPRREDIGVTTFLMFYPTDELPASETETLYVS